VPTISHFIPGDTDPQPFEEFIAAIARLYPAIHAVAAPERIASHSLLFQWKGTEAGPATILMGHYDVVPATDEGWEHPAFSATVTTDQRIVARGSADDKCAVVGILEAAERLTTEGFQPRHDVYLCFGHDEETHGTGAQATVAELERRGVTAELVLDEGGALAEDAFPGISGVAAAVGVTEKGILTLRLRVPEQGGHAATPPRRTSTVRLAEAIVALNNSPFPATLNDPGVAMLAAIGQVTDRRLYRWAFPRARGLRALLIPALAKISAETRALVRTTQAVTQLSAGLAANALAEEATATVNLRIAVDSSVEATIAHVRRAIDDPGVQIEVLQAHEPSAVSPSSGPVWDRLRTAIDTVYAGTPVIPYVMNQASDGRFYTRISPAVYRFIPFALSAAQRNALHARNENIGVATWLQGIDFYAEMLRRS
jgi:carboxypeptidase PM20D1